MFAPTPPKGQSHFVVISVVMLAVLLASVGGAWLMVRDNVGQRGARLMQILRQEGLDHYWPASSDEWMLRRREDGKVIGWRAQFIVAEEGGGYLGLLVQTRDPRPDRPVIQWETWQLNRDATNGDYSAGEFDGVAIAK